MQTQEHPAIAAAQKLYRDGDPTHAIKVLDEALTATPKADVRVQLLIQKAGMLWTTQGLETAAPIVAEADKLATEVAESNPAPRVLTLMTLVQMMASEGDIQAVAQASGVLARTAVRAGADHIAAQAWATRAEHLFILDALDEAAEAAGNAAQISGETEEVRAGRARGYMVLGRVARRKGQSRRAVALFRKVLGESIETDVDFEVEFVLARVRAGEAGADIAGSLDELATMGPDGARDAVKLARLEYWTREGAFERAQQAAADVPDSYEGLYLRTRLAVNAGRAEEAAELAEELVARAPNDARAAVLLGAAAALYGESEPAVAALARGEKLAEDAGETTVRVEAVARMGALLLAHGHHDEARQRGREAIAIAAGDTALAANGRLLLGLAQIAAGQVNEGLSELSATSRDLQAAGFEGRAAHLELHGALAARARKIDTDRLNEAERLADKAGDRRTLVLANVLAAFAAHARGDSDDALARLARARQADHQGQTGLADAIDQAFERLGLRAGTA